MGSRVLHEFNYTHINQFGNQSVVFGNRNTYVFNNETLKMVPIKINGCVHPQDVHVNGKWAVVLDTDIQKIDLDSGLVVNRLHCNGARCPVISADGSRVLLRGLNNIFVWETLDDALQYVYTAKNVILAYHFVSNDTIIANVAGSVDVIIRVWNIRTSVFALCLVLGDGDFGVGRRLLSRLTL